MTNAPLVDGALAVTTGTEVIASVPHTPDEYTEPRCVLCPLCRCHADCRGWSR